MSLKDEYKKVANEYINSFVKKHDYEFSGWVANDVGGMACFIEQYFFNFDDIRYDIDNKLKKDFIFKWQDDSIDYHFNSDVDRPSINLRSYHNGLRYSDL